MSFAEFAGCPFEFIAIVSFDSGGGCGAFTAGGALVFVSGMEVSIILHRVACDFE